VREDLPDHGRIVQRADQPQPAPAIGTRQDFYRERPVHQSRPAPGTRTALRPGGRTLLEASGGVTLQTVRAIAQTGANVISVDALTHSAPALDVALDAD